jgi:hypothetical protein
MVDVDHKNVEDTPFLIGQEFGLSLSLVSMES